MLLVDNYFINNELDNNNNRINFIKNRKQRNLISSSKLNTGDILSVVFWQKGIIYKFEGICISIKKKKLLSSNTSLIIRNVIAGIGVELTVSYYANRVYSMVILDYKRKHFNYKRSKLYYLREKLNRASRVK